MIGSFSVQAQFSTGSFSQMPCAARAFAMCPIPLFAQPVYRANLFNNLIQHKDKAALPGG
jgi:hypothetical protein